MTPRSAAKGFITELDGLRGIAILMVMVHRFWPRPGIGLAADVAGAGWIGVDLFFVISGFLIAGILLDTRGEAGYFRNFYARRVLRIFPLYYLFVGIVWIVFAGNPAFRHDAGSPVWYFVHLGNVPEGVLGHEVPYWLAPVWSLAIEEQFYLTFPLLVYLLDRRRLTVALLAMIVAAPLIRLATTLAMPDHERVQYLFTPCRIDTIAFGCLLAVIIRAVDLERWRGTLLRIAFLALPVTAVLAVASRLDRTSPFDRVLGYSVVAIGCASLVALIVLSRGSRATLILRWAPLRYFGKLCFGLYLLHRPADTLVSVAASRIGVEGDLWLMPFKIGLALALATLSWRLIEQPFLDLKDRFTSKSHPAGISDVHEQPRLSSPFTRLLRRAGLWSLLVAMGSCRSGTNLKGDGGAPDNADGTNADGSTYDSPTAVDASDPLDAPSDATMPAAVVLYPEGRRHSPITPAIAARLQAIATASAHAPRVFAKVGDSITVSADFLYCFDGGNIDLGSHDELATTIDYFKAGNAAGTSPFDRESVAAVGGTTAKDSLDGTPCPFEREVTAIDPQLAVILFGTNEIRYGWTYDEAGKHLWELVDDSISRGIVPIVSTIPPNVGDPSVDARIPTYNRIIRAIAQGRRVPLIDFHRELEALPGRGISQDGLHPSTAPGGGCILTSAGLQYGYNARNLITVEALGRARAALAGDESDATASTRAGAGTAADPFMVSLPAVDLGDTRAGAIATTSDPCGGGHTGHEVVYRLEVSSPITIAATVVDRDGVDVDVHIVAGSTCAGSGDGSATGSVGAGTVLVVVDATSAQLDGEFLLVVERR